MDRFISHGTLHNYVCLLASEQPITWEQKELALFMVVWHLRGQSVAGPTGGI